jgi:DNA-binding transcriptional MerR regulator
VQAPPGFPFKIGELSARSGVPVQTIRFYVTQGLLPGPLKTQRNMGWYSQLHLDRLALVQQLQSDRFLPLKTIRLLVEGNEKLVLDDDESAVTHLRERLARASSGKAEVDAVSLRADRNSLVLSAPERSTLRRLVDGASSDPDRPPDPELARQWVRVRDGLGLKGRSGIGMLNLVGGLVERAVEHELEIMGSRFRRLSPLEAEKILDVIIPCLNRLFELIHMRRLGLILEGQADGNRR